LPIAQNEAGLATVLGHEIAHATSRHGAQRVFQTERRPDCDDGNSGAKPPELLSTHPADQTRINQLEQLMPAAIEIIKRLSNNESESIKAKTIKSVGLTKPWRANTVESRCKGG
jgi:predicted Zn-dependent protease